MDTAGWDMNQNPSWIVSSSPENPIVVIDNGSGSIKAGFAGESLPRHELQNCGAQPFGVKHGSIQQQTAQLFIGDDIFSLPDYFCLRPHQHGLLMDGNLEIAIWEKLFSKSYLNITDLSSHSLIVTEPFNTPTTIRHLLTQIVFEEFGFNRMVISPAQQLIPFAFASSLQSTPVDLWSPSPISTSPKEQLRAGKRHRITTGHKKSQDSLWNSLCSTVMGDTFNPRTSHQKLPESYCQLVVDVGHQTTWIVPMYGELPLEVAALRVDIGGANASALLKNLMTYQQINLERNELLVHHIKEESCFVSLNYMEDLRSLKTQYKSGKLPISTHLAHQYLLPDFNTRDKTSLKNFFKTSRQTRMPMYIPEESDGCPEFRVSQDIAVDLRNIMRSDQDKTVGYLQAFGSSSTTGVGGTCSTFRSPGDNIGFQDDQMTLTLTVERIRTGEVFFNPADYENLSGPTSSTNNQFFPPSTLAADSTTKPSSSTLLTLSPPNPGKQASLAEAIQRSIFSSPPVLQPVLASKILLCGGSTSFPNFARRLYCELRPLLPEDWPINIHQLSDPSLTAWIGASVWSSENSFANYDAFCILKSQYMESGLPNSSTHTS